LLEIEKYREKDLTKEISVLKNKLHEEEKLLVFLQSVLSLQQVEMERKMHTLGDATVFILFESYLSKLNHDISIQEAKVKEASMRVSSVQNALLKVFKKRKVFEKLRERYENEYKEQAIKSENKKYDEIAISRFYYKGRKKDIC
jgi:flagellar FliJ protein